MNKFSLLALCFTAAISGCNTSGSLDNGGIGIADTSANASVQSSNQASLRDALSSGPLSSSAGQRVSNAARNKALDAEYQALENGQPGNPIIWMHSADQKGEVIPFQPYQVGGSNCRRYTHIFIINGKRRPATATACRETNGQWVPLT